jgi:hypothetical protein
MIAALRDERMKNTETKITERKTIKIGFVVKALFPKTGGSSKSLLLGGTKPSPSALKNTNERTHTPSKKTQLNLDGLFNKDAGDAFCGKPYAEKARL